ncbi:hypothetical protein DL764_007885 [Monosporascus ibericus]|uniref:Uncharacterized protein n=1 Tax=Monosporascus ibericus TaxID=155417 RepID=A0A4Q4SYY1_9PEZI|nr:hypothetical protein DL764_007885 [Monosporascus ibericus]
MDNIQNTTARLRRTFAYPTDDDAPSSLSEDTAALDEQEQEELIASLSEQNAARNAQFRLFLLALPVFSALPYLVALFRGGPGASILVAALGLSSLASTAWTLYALPPGVTGIATLDAWVAGGGGSAAKATGTGAHKHLGNRALSLTAQKSPLELYLPYLNIALCAVLVLTGLLTKSATAGQWGHVCLGNLPAIVYAVILAANMVMGGVDPARELSGLRYEYKGA